MISTESYVIHEPNGGFHLETVHYKDIGEHEILVENVAVSICQTDIKAQSGAFMMKPPMIAGHECAGIGESFLILPDTVHQHQELNYVRHHTSFDSNKKHSQRSWLGSNVFQARRLGGSLLFGLRSM